MNILLFILLISVTIGLVNFYYRQKNKEKIINALNEMSKTTIDGLKKMQEIATTKQNFIDKKIMEARLNNKLEYENEIERINEEALEKIKEI